MSENDVQFDEINYWSVLKLDMLEQYGEAYVRTFANNRLKKFYIDGFCGAGKHISKATGEDVAGSPARAFKIQPPFDHYHFVDLDKSKTEHLKTLCGDRKDVSFYNEDASTALLQKILPTIHFEKYNRALCLLDPYGLDLDWAVMEMAGRSNAIDMVLNFPVMDINRNAIWRNPEKVSAKGIARMNKFWGDESWRRDAYVESPRDLFGYTKPVKQSNEVVVDAFITRLKNIAGFKYVARPFPMKNSNQAVVYYLILASPKEVAKNIVEGIFKKYSG